MLDILKDSWSEQSGLSQSVSTVLVVEDEFLVRLMISDALRDQGFKVLEAVTVEEAIAVLGSEIAIDLVFTDVKLPGSMTGLDLACHVAEHFPELPVVVTSGFTGSTTLPRGICFVAKPYMPERVIALITARIAG